MMSLVKKPMTKGKHIEFKDSVANALWQSQYASCLSSNTLTRVQLVDCGMTSVPFELGNLPLKRLDLSGNALAKETWCFLEQRPIMQSLKFLSLARNKLNYVPLVIVDLENLKTLDLDGNQIISKNLPHGLAYCNSLRNLKLSNNCLTVLPQIYTRIAGLALDFGGNNFLSSTESILPETISDSVPSLVTEGARKIWLCRLGYNSEYPMEEVPNAAKDVVRSTPFCMCGQPGIVRNPPKYRMTFPDEFAGVVGLPNPVVTTYTSCVVVGHHLSLENLIELFLQHPLDEFEAPDAMDQ